jgi:hypothetical protein
LFGSATLLIMNPTYSNLDGQLVKKQKKTCF